MRELSNNNHLIKLSIFYTLTIIILVCIPIYFYMKSEIKNYKLNQINLLNQYSLNIKRAIFDFNDSNSYIFHFPKSFKFNVQLFDEKNNLLYSTNENKNIEALKKSFILPKNRLNAKKLLIISQYDVKNIYLKILLLTLCISLFIFISAYLILKQTIIPYKKANMYLDKFFNDAMHELKTPLGILQLNLEILEEKNKETKEVNRCLNAVKSLLFIYEDIEYMIKRKKVIYTKEYLDFSYFLQQRIELFESLALSKKIKLHQEINKNIYLNFNRQELTRIIDNTLSNAIKYSNESSRIIIKLENTNKNILFCIEDFGKGIKDTKCIFDRYYREEDIKGGFGLGLNIVKNICDKNNIDIKVETKIGQGSKFIYKFLNKA